MKSWSVLVTALLFLAVAIPQAYSAEILPQVGKVISTTIAKEAPLEAKAIGRVLSKAGPWIAGLCAGGGIATATKCLEKGESVYAVQFQLDPNASSVYWARWFGWPNIFAVLQVEGMDEYLIPQVFRGYRGGTIIWTFKIPKIPANRAISFHILDDRSASNEIFNNILSTAWHVNIEPGVELSQKLPQGVLLTEALSIGYVRGDIQLVKNKITIVGPKPLCHYTVQCPDPWFSSLVSRECHTEGSITDNDGKAIGVIRISQLSNN